MMVSLLIAQSKGARAMAAGRAAPLVKVVLRRLCDVLRYYLLRYDLLTAMCQSQSKWQQRLETQIHRAREHSGGTRVRLPADVVTSLDSIPAAAVFQGGPQSGTDPVELLAALESRVSKKAVCVEVVLLEMVAECVVLLSSPSLPFAVVWCTSALPTELPLSSGRTLFLHPVSGDMASLLSCVPTPIVDTGGACLRQAVFPRPPGLHLVADTVDEAWESSFWRDLDNAPWSELSRGRRVTHFGAFFAYTTNSFATGAQPFPASLHWLVNKVADSFPSLAGLIRQVDQCTVNEYSPGTGIPPHIDNVEHFGPLVISISLGSAAAMDFTSPDGERISLLLPRRSALLLSGASRREWSHGIVARSSDFIAASRTRLERHLRRSITLRQCLHE